MNGKRYRYRLQVLLALISLLGTSLACDLSPASVNVFGNTALLSDCYQIRYLGFSQGADDSSTWNYRVEKLSCTQEISGWILELPVCAVVVDASPARWEAVPLDPDFQVKGIRWQTSSNFQGGDFSVTLSGKLKRGTVQVGVKGSNAVKAEIQGPVCGPNATTPTVTGTITPTFTTTATSTATILPNTPVPTFEPPQQNTPRPTRTRRADSTPTEASTPVPTLKNTVAPTQSSTPVPTVQNTVAPTQPPTPVPTQVVPSATVQAPTN